MSALSAELARTRSFVFVDAVDEVTELLATTHHGIEPWQLLRNTNVIGRDGHSDYATVLERFWRDTCDRDLHRTSTLIVTGEPGLDRVVPVDVTCRYLDELRSAQHVVIRCTGHSGYITRPDEFAELLGRFVNGARIPA